MRSKKVFTGLSIELYQRSFLHIIFWVGLICCTVTSQIPDVIKCVHSGGSMGAEVTRIILLNNNEKVVFGTTVLAWGCRPYGAMFDTINDTMWYREYISSYNTLTGALSFNNSYYAIGNYITDCWFAKISERGDTLFNKIFGDSIYNTLTSKKVSSESSIVISGFNSSGSSANASLYSFSENGTLLWSKNINRHYCQVIHDFVIDGEGNCIVTGYVGETASSPFKLWLAKISINGVIVWEKMFTIPGISTGKKIISDGNGYYLLADEQRFQDINQKSSTLILKCSLSGELLWTCSLPSFEYYIASDLKSGNNGMVFTLSTNLLSRGADSADVFTLCKITNGGSMIWYGSNTGRGKCLELLDSDNFIVGGSLKKPNDPYNQSCMYYIRLNSPPIIVNTSDDMKKEIKENTSYIDTITVVDNDENDTIRYSFISQVPEKMVIDSVKGIISWIPESERDAGKHAICIVVSDKKEQKDSITIELTVLPVNDAPRIDSIHSSKKTYYELDTVNLVAFVSDEEGDKVSFVWIDANNDTISKSRVLQLLTTLSDSGMKPIRLLVSDSLNTVSIDYIINIQNITDPPVRIAEVNSSTIPLTFDIALRRDKITLILPESDKNIEILLLNTMGQVLLKKELSALKAGFYDLSMTRYINDATKQLKILHVKYGRKSVCKKIPFM